MPQQPGARVRLRAPNPDLGRGLYAGERFDHDGRRLVHRPLQVWLDLASRLQLRLCTPLPCRDDPAAIELTFERLDLDASWHAEAREARYAATGTFARIDKREDPGFVLDFADALARTGVAELPRPRVLALGVHTGDELELLCALAPGLRDRAAFVGVDLSDSALAVARRRFPEPRHRFVAQDINALHEAGLDLGPRFDLALALSTLHSPQIDAAAALRHLVKDRLRPTGSLIASLPNCRHVDGERIPGARTRNFRQPELGLLIKNVAFFRRYLQQHRRKVFVTGQHYLLVTAVPERPPQAG